MESNNPGHCQCQCGATSFKALGTPLLRAFCHCTICQNFNNSAFADITIFRGRDIDLADDQPVQFNTYRRPPNVQRGKCSACDKPAIEFMHLPLMPSFVFVPTENIKDSAMIPAPILHMFYDSRVADIKDDLPKYQGYWSSQLGSTRHLISALMRR